MNDGEVWYPHAHCHKCKETLSGRTIARLWRNGTTYPIVKCRHCGASRSLTSDRPTEAYALHPEDDQLFPVAALVVALLLVACGGRVEVDPPACVVEGEPVACSPDVYTFTDDDAGRSIGDQCSRVGCPSGDRCAVFTGEGTRYGICR